MLIAEGKIDVSQRVVDYIPEFGTNGKDVITVEQVMLHTSGFPHAPLGPPRWDTREGRLEAFGA
jgi:CubicO group peptidase (beta-lactamase class C family)